MKSSTKRFTLAGLSAACAITVITGVGMLAPAATVAEEVDVNTDTYFYDNLVTSEGGEYTLAKRFYEAIAEIHESGDFADGVVHYALSDILTAEQVKTYVENGDITIPKAFGAARDAYLTDHPELFYIDFYKMTISVGRKSGAYVAYIDSGREANLYYDNGFNTPEAVAEAIVKYDAKVNEIVEWVTQKQSEDTYTEKDVYLAREVNRYLAQNITYDYAAYDNKDDENYIAAAYINTPYGGLVEGKAVCGGFSTSYKVIMDKLGVPCITVNGYGKHKDEQGNDNGNGASVYHMWNYVWLKSPAQEAAYTAREEASAGDWYSVDVTWNNSARSKLKYAVLDSASDNEIHDNDGIISSSNYELKYPALSTHLYGSTGETDGLHSNIDYVPVGEDKDDLGGSLQELFLSVSYNGKSAKTLFEEDGLYLAYRVAAYMNTASEKPEYYTETSDVTKGNWEIVWQDWVALEPFREYGEYALDAFDYYYRDTGTETRIYDNTSIYYAQFAVFDIEPDKPFKTHQGDGEDAIERTFYYQYEKSTLEENKPIVIGETKENKAYGTYTPPPYVQSSTPNYKEEQFINDGMRDGKITDKAIIAESRAFTIEITYDEPLHILDTSKPIGIFFVSAHPNAKEYAKFFPINANGDLVELVERPTNSANPTLIANTLKFKFGPSLMYEHNREGYHFIFTNVGSAKQVARTDKETGELTFTTSDKLPNPAYFTFGRLYLACPARFNYDGRLWVDCCAQPTLISNSDLSAMDFKDEDGNSTFSENERSQMMLVAEKADNNTVNTMLDEIGGDKDIKLNKDDIKHSETYDISLQICGKYPTIPDGSYVKIALGFPEGYGPQDEGVVFKLFHRKHIGGDEYIIEEVPCVVTQFGIVATVTSFSPYMVAVVDEEHASTDKTIFASIEGRGGKLTKEDGQIRTVKKGESYTYSITPDAGYRIYKVTLNGTDVTEQVKDNKLNLDYANLLYNNELEIQYISEVAAQRYEENEIEKVDLAKVIVSTEGVAEIAKKGDELAVNKIQPKDDIIQSDKDNTTLIIVCVVVSVVAVIAAGAVAVVIVKKRKLAEVEDYDED